MKKNAPRYLGIAESVRQEILSRELPAHARLPSEPELVRRFGAARATVRRALALLQDEGIVYSRQAVGTFVAEPPVEQDLDYLFSFTEFMTHRGLKPASRLIAAEVQRIEDPQSPVLLHLGLPPGASVLYVRRLRLGGQQPLVIANTWLPAALFPGFLKQDLEKVSVYDIMGVAGYKPTAAVQTIEAVTLEEADAKLLTVPAGSAALLIRRAGNVRGVPVEYAIDYYRADRTRFRVRLGVPEKGLGERVHHDLIAL
jgi:GntR family transcriptional regulator